MASSGSSSFLTPLMAAGMAVGIGLLLNGKRKETTEEEYNNGKRERADGLEGAKTEADLKEWLQPAKLTKGSSTNHNVYTIVLTGGPCAGKTTALARISTYLSNRGFRVFTVPEAATMLFSNGATFSDLSSEENIITFQANLLLTQLHLEDTFFNLAKSTKQPCVLLCDRGAMDGSVYVEPETWDKLLEIHNFDPVFLRDQRYNAIFHLVTAADGAEKFYTLENNATRTESAEEARKLDQQLQQAWVGHPKLIVFENLEGGFEDKLQRVISATSQLVGLPDHQREARKYLLKCLPDSLPVVHEKFYAEKVYLKAQSAGASDDYIFIRKRSQKKRGRDGKHVWRQSYQITFATFDENGTKTEVKRIIRKRTYEMAVQVQADPTRKIVRQIRNTFLWNSQYYEIYNYLDEDLALLVCQVSKGDKVEIPDFLDVDREVTGEREFSAYTLSLKDLTKRPPAKPRSKSAADDEEGEDIEDNDDYEDDEDYETDDEEYAVEADLD